MSQHRLIVVDIGLDIVLLYEIARCVNAKLETYREALESKGFRISRSKIEYLKCTLNSSQSASVDIVTLQNQDYKGASVLSILSILAQLLARMKRLG